MRSEGFLFSILGVWGWSRVRWTLLLVSATVRNRLRTAVVGLKLACLWGKPQKHVFLNVSEDELMSFCVADVARHSTCGEECMCATFVGLKLACLWGKPQKRVFLNVSEDVFLSFSVAGVALCDIPIGSMYAIWGNIWGILMVNVTIYIYIHRAYMDPIWSYGIIIPCVSDGLCVRGRRDGKVAVCTREAAQKCLLHDDQRRCHVVSRGTRGTLWHFTLYSLHSTLHTLNSSFHTLHFTLHTLHFILHTPHFLLQTLYSTLYTPHSTLYTPHCTLHTLHCTSHSTFYTPHSPLDTPHFTYYTPHSTLYTPHSSFHTLHFTLHTLHFTVQTPYFTLSTLHSILHTSHFTFHTPHFRLHTLDSTL